MKRTKQTAAERKAQEAKNEAIRKARHERAMQERSENTFVTMLFNMIQKQSVKAWEKAEEQAKELSRRFEMNVRNIYFDSLVRYTADLAYSVEQFKYWEGMYITINKALNEQGGAKQDVVVAAIEGYVKYATQSLISNACARYGTQHDIIQEAQRSALADLLGWSNFAEEMQWALKGDEQLVKACYEAGIMPMEYKLMMLQKVALVY